MNEIDVDWDIVNHEDVLSFKEEHVLPETPETIAKIRTWLQPTDFDGEGSEYQKHLSSHLSGTCDWFRTSNAYRKWHTSDEHGMLWARGIPGSGKSVLAASLVHKLSQEQVPVLYFFFRQIVDANHTPNSALRDWLAQVLDYSSPLQVTLKQHLGGEFGSGKSRWQRVEQRHLESLSISELWAALRTALMHLAKAYIVVDALDEMNPGEGTDVFLQTLSSLAQWRPLHIKVLITSRPVASVERALRLENILRIRLEESKVDLDIIAYVKSKLAASSIPLEHHHSIQAAVPGNANGLFLYAKLAMDAFLRENTNVEQVLRELPENLDILYSRLLREHSSTTKTPIEIQVLILQWATHSIRSLRLIELSDMLSTTQLSGSKDLKAAKGIVRSACGPLLEMLPDESLCVVHHSLTEFLNGTTRAGPQDYPILDPGPTHNRLAIICLSYLQSGCLSAVPDATPKTHFGIQDKQTKLLAPFTKYAAANWHIHARKASSGGIDQSEINILIDKFTAHPHFEKWARLVAISPSASVTPFFVAVRLGLTEYTKLLLSRPGTDITKDTPLPYAAEKGFNDVVDSLLQAGADPNQLDSSGYTALHRASMNNHSKVVSTLLRAGCDPNIFTAIVPVDPGFGRTSQHSALWYACHYGHVATVVEILPYIKNTSTINQALLWAIEKEKTEVVEKILQCPIVNVKDHKFGSYLHEACNIRNPRMIELLLTAGAPQIVPKVRFNYFMEEQSSEASEVFEVSYEDDEPGKGLSALHALAKRGSIYGPKRGAVDDDTTRQCFALLFRAGANVNQPDGHGDTPLHGASDSIAVEILLAAGAEVDSINDSRETPLHTCNDSSVLQALVTLGNADTEKADNGGLSPLLATLSNSYGRGGIAKALALLELGASARSLDDKGDSALHYAIKNFQREDRLDELIHALCKTADVNLQNHLGEAPIHLTAVAVKAKETVFQILVAAGADTTPGNSASKGPYFQWISRSILSAEEIELAKVTETLKSCGASLNTTDYRGQSLLHIAVASNKVAHVLFLVAEGLDPTATDCEGNTLWHALVPKVASSTFDRHKSNDPYSRPAKIFFELLRLGVDPEKPNNHGRTPLHLLSTIWPDAVLGFKKSMAGKIGGGHTGQTTAFDLVLSYQKDIDYGDKDRITALHLASTFSEYQTRRLVEAGSDPRCTTSEGCNALHIAARSRQPNIVGMLLENLHSRPANAVGEALDAIDTFGRTPLFYACASGVFESVKMLVDAGASVNSPQYETSPWKGCAQYEREIANWSYSSRYQTEGVGGVLIADTHRPQNKDSWSHRDRIQELFAFLYSKGATERDYLDQAIAEAAEYRADYTVECFLRLQASVSLEADWATNLQVSESIERRQAERDAFDKPCKNCKVIHNDEPLRRLTSMRDYHLIPEAIPPKDRVKLIANGSDVETRIHPLIKDGMASVLARMITLEDAQRMEDPAWLEEQESRLTGPNGWINKGLVEPLLLSACRRRVPNMDVIQLLVEQIGVDINAQHHDPAASGSGYAHNAFDDKGQSPLHALVRGENWWCVGEALPYLLSHGADTEVRDSRGKTPLSAALDRTDWLIFNKCAVELLLQHGADVNVIDKDGHSCLAKALLDMEITQLLLARGATVTRDVWIQVLDLKSVELLALFLSSGADPNVRGVSRYDKRANRPNEVYQDEMYPLHYLLSRNRYGMSSMDLEVEGQMAQLLLDHGANPSAEYEGSSILHELINKSDFLHPLLGRRLPSLKLEMQNADGDTPLLLACHPRQSRDTSKDNAEGQTIIDLLILRGADICARSGHGNNILHYMVGNSLSRSNRAFEHVLYTAPELINMPNNSGSTPLHGAFERANYLGKQITTLLDNGGDIHAVDGSGNTPLHLLLKGSWYVNPEGVINNGTMLKLFNRLLAMGANINAPNHAGETPVFSFFRSGRAEIIIPDDPDKPHGSIWPPPQTMYKLPEYNEEPIYAIFSDAGVDWKVLNAEGQNLLHIIASLTPSQRHRAGERFKALMAMGLDAGLEDMAQRTPVDIAADLGNKGVLALFRDKAEANDNTKTKVDGGDSKFRVVEEDLPVDETMDMDL